jgi:hypothetical protein
LEALKSLEEGIIEEEKGRTNTASPSVGEILKSLVLRGAKSAKSPTPPPDEVGTFGVNTMDAKPKKARRTLVTTQDQLAEVIADLKDENLVAWDLETTGLDPRGNSIRLLSLASKSVTYIVDCQSADPTGLFPILTEETPGSPQCSIRPGIPHFFRV